MIELKVVEYLGEPYLAKFTLGKNTQAILLGKLTIEPLSEQEDLINIGKSKDRDVWVQRVVRFGDGTQIRRRPLNAIVSLEDGREFRIEHLEADRLIYSNDGDGKYLREWYKSL